MTSSLSPLTLRPTLSPLHRLSRHLSRSLLGLACLAALAPSAHAKGPKDPYLDGEVLVRLHTTAGLAPLLTKYQLAVVAQSGARPIYRLSVQDGGSVTAKVKALLLEPEVIAAEANVKPQAPEARKNAVWAIGSEVEYREQWAPDAIRLADAHLLSQGAGIRVAVLDTGVDPTHPALAGKLLPGRDFVDGDNDPREEGSTDNGGFGHGTHVAGLVALAAPAAKIMPIRVLDPDGRGDVWKLADALAYALDPDGNPATDDGAHVVNMSLGTLDRTSILDAAMTLAACAIPKPTNDPATDFTDTGYDQDKARCATSQRGAVIIAAAGNDGSRDARQYPAAENVYGLLPIGATAANHRYAAFSNTGSWIDVAAPGDHITSSVPGGQYGTWSGTSMAAPLAAGVAALVRSRSPKLNPVDVTRRLERTGAAVCGNVKAVQIDAWAALKNKPAPDLSCL